MSAATERMANKIVRALVDAQLDVPFEPDDEMRTGGSFFTVYDGQGNPFDVTVVEQ